MEKTKIEKLAYFRSQTRSGLSTTERTELSTLCRLEKEEDRINLGPETFDWMVDLLYRHDPIRLVNYGVPHDEYDNEARKILKALKTYEGQLSLGKILQIVYDIFAAAFGGENDHTSAGSIADIPYLLAAQEIYRNISSILK